MAWPKISVGSSDFAEYRKGNYYYVDKTGLIEELLKTPGIKVTLITRPRRFGKTMNMSMLAEFFDIRKDSRPIFSGLKIADNKELCEAWMNQWPVIHVTFRSVFGSCFKDAYSMIEAVIAELYKQHIYLLENPEMMVYDREIFDRIAGKKASGEEIKNSLLFLTRLLGQYYGKTVILLIDEYDVPLAKASDKGYYEEMLYVIRGILQALKDNSFLHLAVVTGCLRIAKESIFTGTNNFITDTISDNRLDEFFGFTQEEVDRILADTQNTSHSQEIKNWYDGYRFGSTDVYCPWDVLNHCDKIKENAAAFPENYWVHTSSNEAVKKIIQMSGNITTKREIERLLAGEEIVKEIRQELTYQEMYQSVENIWSLLFMTGYLTQRQRLDASHYKLAIPNLEVRDIFKTQIMEYFKEGVAKDGDTLKQLCDALKGGDAEKVERLFEGYLKKTISIRDTFVEKSLKENFYHGILLGILGVKEDWGVFSNRETGDGYSDIMIETEDSEMGIIIEIKYAGDGNLLNACEKALKQVEETKYEETLLENGVEKILKYGIACYMKHCKVMCSER